MQSFNICDINSDDKLSLDEFKEGIYGPGTVGDFLSFNFMYTNNLW